MPADVETMAYYKESQADVPWHGFGNPITHEATPEEMAEQSGTLWTVSKRATLTYSTPKGLPDGTSLVQYLLNGGQLMPVEKYFTIVRDSDNKVFGPAGPDYVPTQNVSLFNFLKKFTEAGQMRMETAGALQGGKQVWVLAKLKMRLTLPGGDVVEGYLLISSPHIWGKSLVIKFVTIRVVCHNTFTMAMGDTTYGKGFRMPHVRPFDEEVAREAEITLGLAAEMFGNFEATSNLLAKTPVTDDVVVRYMADLMQPEMIRASFGKNFYTGQSEAKQAELLLDPNSPQLDPTQFKRSAARRGS
jgi:phage/plasmid-like protein (TIGR03299 family)